MKSLILLLVLFLSANYAYSNKYESAMESAISKLYSANDLQSYLDATATFERIGQAESGEWLPYYYAGLGNIWASHTTQDAETIDGYLDKAQIFVEKAGERSPENDEIITLQGYIYR